MASRISLSCAVLAFFAGLCTAQAQSILRPALYGARYRIDKTNADFKPMTSPQGGYASTLTVSNPEGGEFRLLFDNITAGTGRFDLVLDTAAGTIGTIRSEDLTASSTFASDAFRGGAVTVTLVAPAPPQGLSFHIAELAYERPGGAVLDITGEDQRVKIASLAPDDRMRRAARAVAKLEFSEPDGDYVCTGFLVGPDELVTNHHCIGDPDTCKTAIAIFGYITEDAQVEQARCLKLVKTDVTSTMDIAHNSDLPRHDFALIKLDRRAGDRWGILKFAQHGPGDGAKLYMPQHPDGRTQEVSVIDCAVAKQSVAGLVEPDSDFSDTCDTEEGASGSPVLDTATDEVVGLHHLGFSQGFDAVNRAVRAEKIRAEIFPPL